ncbi:MAG: helix-turn-helix domain-containing protein [Pyrinomonadaceae bacterium]|nr:helix-turn-helix domain-containing protein [Pyrinomonadaceae bacterium]
MPAKQTLPARTMNVAHHGEAEIYDDGYLRVEHRNYYVACGGRVLSLPLKEFLILSRLARSAERIVTVEDIWQHAWGAELKFNSESLHVHIYRLRRKLAPYGLQIETMVNVGYRLTKS